MTRRKVKTWLVPDSSTWWNIKGLAKFLSRLRDLAIELRYLIKGNAYTRQYNIVCVVSVDEISDSDNTFIDNVWEELFHRLEAKKLKIGGRFLEFNRSAFVMNLSDMSELYHHTEARLLDPTGEARQEMGVLNQPVEGHGSFDPDESSNQHYRPPKDFMTKMKKKVLDTYGKECEPITVILSNLIPCTDPNHRCAELIPKYADKTGEKLIVSYEKSFYKTDTKTSVELMTKSLNVYLLRPRAIRASVNRQLYTLFKTRSVKDKEKTKLWVIPRIHYVRYARDDHEFTEFRRIERRRRSKGIDRRQERKQKKRACKNAFRRQSNCTTELILDECM